MTVITVIQRNRNTPKCSKIADASGFCSFDHLVGKGNQGRGTVTPSTFAARKLMTRSNLIGA
jgi:hypothetical protein